MQGKDLTLRPAGSRIVIVCDPLSMGAANCSVAVCCLWDRDQVMMCLVNTMRVNMNRYQRGSWW